MRGALPRSLALGLVVAGCLSAAPAHAGDATPGCLTANEAFAAGGDGAPPSYSEGFYHQTFVLDVSTDGFAKRDLTISIEDVCKVPKGYEKEAVQLAGVDGVAVISSRTRVYKGKRLLKGANRRAQIDGADTMSLTVHLARPNHWRSGEDGKVPTFSTRRADITD